MSSNGQVSGISDLTIAALERALDGLAVRQAVVANNVANVDTPGFKASRALFEEQLRAALEKAKRAGAGQRRRGLEQVEASVVETSGALRRDGNNVAIEQEIGELGKTALTYEAVAQILRRKVHLIRMAISEGVRG